jgi:hypothetical protein
VTAVPSDAALERGLAVAGVRISVRLALGGLVGVSAVAHALLAWLRLVPTAFPDEYLYGALGRSIAAGHGMTVRGGAARFPGLLEPIVTAPAWLLPGVEAPYRAIQALNATAMSLAAIPAYLIARRLRLGQGASLAIAALTVAAPQLALASQILSEPLAYPLVLASIAAGMALVEHPTRRAAVLFLGLAALATLDRLQFAILPLCVLAAAVVDSVRGRDLGRTMRRHAPLGSVVVLGVAAAAALALSGRLGYYQTAAPSAHHLGGALKMVPVDLYTVLLSAGAVIAPSALVGGGLALVRPRSRAEGSFGVIATTLCAGLLAQSTLYGDTGLIQERYLFYLVPLLAICFALRVSRRKRRWLGEAWVAAGLAAFAAAVPLAGYVAAQSSPAPFEGAVRRLQISVGEAGQASLLVAAAATLLVAAGALAAVRSRGSGAGLLALSALASLGVFAGAVSYERMTNVEVRAAFLPPDSSWVDHAGVGRVSYLATPGTQRAPLLETLFWNPSIEHVLLLPGSAPPDKFAVTRLKIDPGGALAPAPFGPLLLDESMTTVDLRGVQALRSWGSQTLAQRTGRVRVAALMTGRLRDGSLFSFGGVEVWPQRAHPAGWVELRVRASGSGPGTFALREHGRRWRTVTLRGGESRLVRAPACGERPWRGGFRARGVASGLPHYVPDPSACSV